MSAFGGKAEVFQGVVKSPIIARSGPLPDRRSYRAARTPIALIRSSQIWSIGSREGASVPFCRHFGFCFLTRFLSTKYICPTRTIFVRRHTRKMTDRDLWGWFWGRNWFIWGFIGRFINRASFRGRFRLCLFYLLFYLRRVFLRRFCFTHILTTFQIHI